MKKEFIFETYNGKQLLQDKKELLVEMEEVFKKRECGKENVLQFIDEDSHIMCMLDDQSLVGFAWLAFAEKQHLAELCWFVTDKDKIKGIDGKKLLDKVIDYCQEKEIKSIKFNCFDQSWARIRDKEHLFEHFGYKLSEENNGYDMSIDI